MEKRVGFSLRLAAALIDAAVILALAAGVGGTLGGLIGGAAGRAFGGAGADAAATAAAGAFVGALVGALAATSGVTFLYSLIEAFTGASPGKMALRLKIGLEDGRRAPLPVCVRRWAVKYSGALFGLLGAVPLLSPLAMFATAAGLLVFLGCFLALGDRRQALHDLAAGTAVFRTPDLRP
ncbi:MAG TPA: RDD family protein [Vicinamibacterales bacterium]|nr:RDD family protein [Vicinamibacterales bacterium]HOG30372.1 RDD family protein [Vicinamibacterales bacterium]HOQ59342.1 RDD family protein [Vicinamibacterales bacterium]HPK71618.1 RDD family protein [Vicinamibacterales bacterium]HPW21265.1 RDD family protein [Vicinamibacterales bacterium]